MIDHILLDVIAALREAFEGALLEQQAVEERFQVDVFLGDVSFETSYSLPGEDSPPRVRADLSLDWPTWSQSAYRSWSIGEPPGGATRARRRDRPARAAPRRRRPIRPSWSPPSRARRPSSASERLEQSGPSRSSSSSTPAPPRPPAPIEIAYQGSVRLERTAPRRPDQARRPGGALWPAGWHPPSCAWRTSTSPSCRPTRTPTGSERGQLEGRRRARSLPQATGAGDGAAPRDATRSRLPRRAPSRPATSRGAPWTRPWSTPAAKRSPAPVVSSTGPTDQALTTGRSPARRSTAPSAPRVTAAVSPGRSRASSAPARLAAPVKRLASSSLAKSKSTLSATRSRRASPWRSTRNGSDRLKATGTPAERACCHGERHGGEGPGRVEHVALDVDGPPPRRRRPARRRRGR